MQTFKKGIWDNDQNLMIWLKFCNSTLPTGTTEFILTPFSAHSMANDLARLSTPALAAPEWLKSMDLRMWTFNTIFFFCHTCTANSYKFCQKYLQLVLKVTKIFQKLCWMALNN